MSGHKRQVTKSGAVPDIDHLPCPDELGIPIHTGPEQNYSISEDTEFTETSMEQIALSNVEHGRKKKAAMEVDDDKLSDSISTVKKGFCATYFCEGQKLDKKAAEQLAADDASWYVRYRKQIGMAIPFLIVHAFWWAYMAGGDNFGAFTKEVGVEKTPAFYMSITMIFGSMLAGATSEGGAAVAFPIMTLVFGIPPPVARDFSYMIQSVGMTAAAFTILFMKVQVEWKSIIYCTIGGVAGLIFGLEEVAPNLTPPYAKMYFVTIWASFAASLFYLNRLSGRKVYLTVAPAHLPEIWNSANLFPKTTDTYPFLKHVANWKALVLLASGFLGGIFTAMSGSGIDICSFAVLTLLFRVTEKTATPTSVVLMAINTMVAAFYREYGQDGLMEDSWHFLKVCAPIVVIGAPLGSVLGSFLHRLVLAAFVYVTDFAQFVGALAVVKPWTNEKCNEMTDCTSEHICWSSAGIMVAGLIAFYVLQWAGEKMISVNDEIEKEAGWSPDGVPREKSIELGPGNSPEEHWSEIATNEAFAVQEAKAVAEARAASEAARDVEGGSPGLALTTGGAPDGASDV